MGIKRKTEKSEEDIRRKIRRLEKKLKDKCQDPDPTLEEMLEGLSEVDNQDNTQHFQTFSWIDSPAPQWQSPLQPQMTSEPFEVQITVDEPTVAEETPSTSSTQPAPINNEVETPLGEDILQLLGDAPKADIKFGPRIHSDIATRWQYILNKGLEKDCKEKIIEEYLVPSNCDLLTSPTLNPELKAAMSESALKKDFCIATKQKNVGVALAALGRAMDMIITNKTCDREILKPISDACKLLCDIHYSDTSIRRHFILASVNNNVSSHLTNLTRDQYLFGEQLAEKLKEAKNIKNAGDSLKNTKTIYNPKNTYNRPSTSKNYFLERTQYRNTHHKPEVQPRRPSARGAAHNNRAGRPRQRSPLPPPPPKPKRRF